MATRALNSVVRDAFTMFDRTRGADLYDRLVDLRDSKHGIWVGCPVTEDRILGRPRTIVVAMYNCGDVATDVRILWNGEVVHALFGLRPAESQWLCSGTPLYIPPGTHLDVQTSAADARLTTVQFQLNECKADALARWHPTAMFSERTLVPHGGALVDVRSLALAKAKATISEFLPRSPLS